MKIHSVLFGLLLAGVSVSAFSQDEPCGNEPFKHLYDEVDCFSEDMARVAVLQRILVRKDKEYDFQKYGFIDRTGKVVIPIEWDSASKFKEGLVAVKNYSSPFSHRAFSSNSYFLDKTGKSVLNTSKYDLTGDFNQGFAWVANFSGHSYEEVKRGLIDKTGKLIIPQHYLRIYPIFQKGKIVADKYFPAQKRIYTGMINLKNEILIPFEYDFIGDIHNGVLSAEKEGKFGQIDTTGKIIVPFVYDNLEAVEKAKKGN